MQDNEMTYAQTAEVFAALERKGHRPGRIRYERTKGGKRYAYVSCLNVKTITHMHDGRAYRAPIVSACNMGAEYSMDRRKLTRSTVAYRCEGA